MAEKFEKEGPKSFRKWALEVSMYVELSDPEASEILTKALDEEDPPTDQQKKEWASKNKYRGSLARPVGIRTSNDQIQS